MGIVETSVLVSVMASRSSLQFRMKTKRKVTTRPEAVSGSTTERSTLKREAPMSRAARSSSTGTSSTKASIIQITYGRHVAT